MRNKLSCLLLSLCLLAALFAGCAKSAPPVSEEPEDASAAPSEETDAPSGAEENEAPSETPSGLYAKVEQEETQKSYKADDGTEILRVYISLPRLSGAGMDYSGINQHYENEAETHLIYAEDELYAIALNIYGDCSDSGKTFYPYESEQTYRTAYNRDGYICFIREYAEYSGNLLSGYSVTAESFRLEDGQQLYLDDLFDGEESEYTAVIQEEVKRQIEEEPEKYFGTYEELVSSRYQKECWYLTEGGICVFYQPRDLSEEMNEFLIPYEAFGDTFVLW